MTVEEITISGTTMTIPVGTPVKFVSDHEMLSEEYTYFYARVEDPGHPEPSPIRPDGAPSDSTGWHESGSVTKNGYIYYFFDGTVTFTTSGSYSIAVATQIKNLLNPDVRDLTTATANVTPMRYHATYNDSEIRVKYADCDTHGNVIDDTYATIEDLNDKQNTLTAGAGIAIINDTISCTVPGFEVVVVQTLPATGESGKIYLVPSAESGSQNVYDEYIWVNNSWEKIGSTQIDLSNYYTKSQTDGLLAQKAGLDTATTSAKGLMSSADKVRVDALNVEYENETLPGQPIDLSDVTITSGVGTYSFTYDAISIYPDNLGVDNSYAYAVLSFNMPRAGDLEVNITQNSEQSYDYGIISDLDADLIDARTEDDDYKWKGKSIGTQSQTLIYTGVSQGQHYITAKYIKDSSTSATDEQFSIDSLYVSNIAPGLYDIDTHNKIDMWYSKSESDSKYVTLGTEQTITNKKVIRVTEGKTYGGQETSLKVLSTHSKNDIDVPMWAGRMMVGNHTQTFLMGTYRGVTQNEAICGLGAHTWSGGAIAETGGAWEDVYINPDGGKAVYIGDYGWKPNSGWLKVQNSNQNTNGKVYYNKGSISSPSWKEVAVTDPATTSANGLMSSSDKVKINGVESGAQVNVIDTVKVDGTALSITNKAVDIDLATPLSTKVGKTGNETIAGTKTFSSTISGNISGSSASCTGNSATATIANRARGLIYIVGTGTTAGVWTGTSSDITSYYDGLSIAYYINISGASTTTLNINNLGAKTVRRNNGNLTTHLPVGTVVILTYVTISNVGYWVWADYDGNTDIKVRQTTLGGSDNVNRSLILSYVVQSTTGNTDNLVYRSTKIYANDSTGNLQATKFNGYTLGSACQNGVDNNTTVGALMGLTNWTASTNLVTRNTIAFWDGRYQSTNNSSNLAYCKKGAFGDACIKSVTTTPTKDSAGLITSGGAYNECTAHIIKIRYTSDYNISANTVAVIPCDSVTASTGTSGYLNQENTGVKISKAGLYRIYCSGYFEPNGIVGRAQIGYKKNSTSEAGYTVLDYSANNKIVINYTDIVRLAVNDMIYLEAWSNNGAKLLNSIPQSYLSVEYLGV